MCAMVKQTRIIFDVSDIQAVRVVCGLMKDGCEPCDGEELYQFGRQMALKPQHPNRKGWRCPKCGEEWKSEFGPHEPQEVRQIPPAEMASLTLLGALETLKESKARFKLRFEIDGETDN